jgi:hypothetical protein
VAQQLRVLLPSSYLPAMLVCRLPALHGMQMWQRGRSISKRDWTLLRVAVVACVNDVYYGRLFFGDPETQQVLWDCDVRPSDATFLALKVTPAIHSSSSSSGRSGSGSSNIGGTSVMQLMWRLHQQRQQQERLQQEYAMVSGLHEHAI